MALRGDGFGRAQVPKKRFLGPIPTGPALGAYDLLELWLKGQESVIWTQPSDLKAGHCVGVKHTWDSSELV